MMQPQMDFNAGHCNYDCIACSQICPTGARLYGNLRDRESDLVKFLREHDYQVLKPHLNTGSKLFYNALTAEIS